MTGATNELDPSRQEPPQAKPDVFIAPTEGQRRAATIQRRKRIGKHLSEALIAAVVGGVVTIMVWHQASPPTAQTTETKSVVIAGAELGTSANPITLPAQSGANAHAQMAAIAPKAESKPVAAHPETELNKGSAQTTARIETIPTPTAMPMNPPAAAARMDDKNPARETLAKNGATPTEEMMEDAISAEMDPPSLAETANAADHANPAKIEAEESRQVPVIQAKSEPVKGAESAIPAAKAVSVTKAEAKAAPLPAPKAVTHAAEAKAVAAPTKADAKPATIAATAATKTDAKAAPATHSEAKAGFPQAQADGHFLVTAGSYSNAMGAEKIQKKLADAGIPVRLRKSTLNNHTVHHLLTGPFANAELASQAVATIKERTGIEARSVSMPEANPQSAKNAVKQPATAAKPTASKESPAKEMHAKATTPAKEIIKAMAPVHKETTKAAAPIKEIAKASAPVKELAKATAPVKETKEAKDAKEVKEVAKATAPAKETAKAPVRKKSPKPRLRPRKPPKPR
ncbi:MAG: SPOR domain-containing protein [Magnetococcales bacterium]|nr:SPOR domain-containing protein [Magnetococcales bacterium]